MLRHATLVRASPASPHFAFQLVVAEPVMGLDAMASHGSCLPAEPGARIRFLSDAGSFALPGSTSSVLPAEQGEVLALPWRLYSSHS